MLIILGILVGLLSGLLGVGGGIMLVPALIALNYEPLNAVAISAVAVLLISLSGSIYNFRNYIFNIKNLVIMSLPCVFLSQLGVFVASYISPSLLLLLFAILLLSAILLLIFTRKKNQEKNINTNLALLSVGGTAGFLSGLFGVGGGFILVPLQVSALSLDIKVAIRNSLVIILVASCFSVLGHAFYGNIMLKESLFLALGGIFGAQVGAYALPKIHQDITSKLFIILLGFLFIYVFWQSIYFYKNYN
jgi:uncharacterized protein